MAIRQQQVVFICVALIVGWGVKTSLESSGGRRASGGKKPAPEFVDHLAPDVGLVRAGTRSDDALAREFFTEPSDTRPLPLLGFEVPPLAPLPSLRPAPAAGPMPKLYGQHLRSNLQPTFTAGLFDELADAEASGEVDLALEEAASVDWDLLTPEERAERLETYRRQYDWIHTNQLHYGRILNRNRFELRMPLDEPLMFLEFEPETGQERYPGMAPVSYDVDRGIEDFGLAASPLNKLEKKRVEFSEEVTAGQYGSLMAFADRAYLAREAGPRALEIAQEFYQRAVPLTAEPDPQLGLARCHEAGFRFEEAFATYHALMDAGHEDHPVVLARLGVLEARFRMFEQAKQHLQVAARYGSSEWEVQLALGNLLLQRGKATEALVALQKASRIEPQAAEHQRVRAWIRSRLGDAYLATGDFVEARKAYTRALQAEPGMQVARAGIASVLYLTGDVDDASLADTADGAGVLEAPEFELLLADGLLALQRGEWAAAAEQLMLAADVDPLRAGLAWRGLSWLAEMTDHTEEALRYAEMAYAVDPTDPYTLVQRGRILASRDDVVGAFASFTAAVDQELRLPDAVAGLGRLAFLDGRFEDAEMYFERSVFQDEGQAAVHALRGLNALMLEDVDAARSSFERARSIDRRDANSRAGLAWCAYLDGEPVEAIALYRELDDSLRALPDDDPMRIYVQHQIERIDDHVEKVIWTDRFERQSLRNGWQVEEGAGPLVSILDGSVLVEGSFTESGRSRLKREYPAGDFISIEVELTIGRDNRSRVGVFVSLEQRRRDRNEIKSEATISRNLDGSLQTRVQRRGGEDAEYLDVPVLGWNVEETVILRIERMGESSDTEMRLSINGIPVADRVPMPGLGRTTAKLWVGVFTEGDTGRSADVKIDRVEIVKRER